jgi:lipopolysaccharide/colanic/teichoic acid biosynthesis glycosyltransferase
LAYLLLKRVFDIILSVTALLITSPIFILAISTLRLTGEGDVFFRQERVGRNLKPFSLLKFVTMQRGSEKVSSVTAPDDPRVLPVGRFLRKTKINELPQLINVLRGDMSIVGFRPLVEESFNLYDETTRECLFHMKPGLTGIGSVIFHNEEELIRRSAKEKMRFYEEDIIPLKGELELWYFNHRSFMLDLKIVIATALILLAGDSKFYLRWFDLRTIMEKSNLGKELTRQVGTVCGDL